MPPDSIPIALLSTSAVGFLFVAHDLENLATATVVIHRDVSQRRHLRRAGTQGRLTVSGGIIQYYRLPTYLPLQAASSLRPSRGGDAVAEN